jgi:sulfatase modifying factor 1
MKYLFFILWISLPALLAAQTCDYDKLYREGKTFAKSRQYKKALYKYNSARRCDPTKGETVDAAIEALLDKVEGEKKAVDKALEDLRKTSGKVVDNLLRDAATEVYHLRYAEALEKMKAAGEIGHKGENVGRSLMEIAFFYAESGRFSDARDVTALAYQLLWTEAYSVPIDTTNPAATRAKFRKALKCLDPARYAELEARYYPVMIDVKGGEFILGCEKWERCDTLPQVKLSDFQLARTETTFWQFALYAAATELKIQDFSPQWGLDGDNPVVKVSWDETLEYANWLSVQQSLQPAFDINSLQIIPNAKGYRLPTEAEWEYAAGGGIHQDPFLYSGNDNLAAVAWYSENADTRGVGRTHPVGTQFPNSLGLQDMSGNVWEWCWDYYEVYQTGIFENPTGPISGENRVLRGGSWDQPEGGCRIVVRGRYPGYVRLYNLGFRLARH